MRRMVGGDDVNRTIDDASYQRHLVGYRTNRRIHLPSSVLFDHAVVEEQIMRRGLTGHGDPVGFGVPDELYALFGGNMAYMQPASGLCTQTYIPLYLAPFALRADTPMTMLAGVLAVVDISAAQQTVHLTMLDDHTVHRRNPPHRLAHQPLVLDTSAVIRETRYVRAQFLYINEFTLAFLAEGDTCVRMDANVAVTRNNVHLSAQMIHRIGRRVHIRHSEHITITRTRSRLTPRENRLFIRETRLTEMHMHIHETGYSYFS